MTFLEKLWLLFSQAVNVLFFGGDPDESLSARAWRENRDTWIDRIDSILGGAHCKTVYELQEQRQMNRRLA